MIQAYIPILLFILIGLGLGGVLIVLSRLLSVSFPDPEKNSPFECGFPAFEDARIPFDVRFYLVAILFIIFDLETAFMFPWAVVFDQIGWSAFVGMGIFLCMLLIGFIYEWKQGALEWE